ncbi:MAG: hypothetical protein LDL37_09390, partial [Asticcacaulis sp.]|uniref:hypothetical protein n=1 Tax=Asticcacaulis sp. TaxID=1872648 RepID=UPI0025B7BE15
MTRQLSEGVKSNLGKLGLCGAAMLDPTGMAAGLGIAFSGKDIAEALLALGIAGLGNSPDKSKPHSSVERLKYHLGHEARFDLDADPATSDAVEAFFNEAVLDIAFPQRDFSRFRDALDHAQGLNAGIADAMLRRLPGWDGLETGAQAL